MKELRQAASIEKRNEKLSEITMMMNDISEAEKMSRCMDGADPRARAALCANLSDYADALALQPDAAQAHAPLKNEDRKSKGAQLGAIGAKKTQPLTGARQPAGASQANALRNFEGSSTRGPDCVSVS